MNTVTLQGGELLSKTGALITRNIGSAMMWIVVLTAIGVGSDLFSPDRPIVWLSSVVALLGLAQVTQNLLDDSDLLPHRDSGLRFWSLFGLCLLTNLGIIVGLVLLVLPGIYLAARWWVAVPILYAEDVGVFDAMQRSWEETKGNFAAMVTMLVVIYLPMLTSIGVFALLSDDTGNLDSVPLLILVNLLISGASVCAWYGAVATYEQLRPGSRTLAEIFA